VYEGDLYAAGVFESVGSLTVNNIARWDGESWWPLASGGQVGVDNDIQAMAVFHGRLFAGGNLQTAGGQAVNHIASWGCTGDLNNDGIVDELDRVQLCAALGTIYGDIAFNAVADLNEDRAINQLDQILFNQVLPPCIGDVVSSSSFLPPGDGQTTGADLAFLLGSWGPGASCSDFVTTVSFHPPPDGVVDGADLAVLLGAWGACK